MTNTRSIFVNLSEFRLIMIWKILPILYVGLGKVIFISRIMDFMVVAKARNIN